MGWVALAATLVAQAALGADPAGAPAAGLGLLRAVELTLANDPNVAIQKSTVMLAEGALQEARGDFDPLFTVDSRLDDLQSPVSETARSDFQRLDTTLGLGKLFRSGLSIRPGIEMTRTEDAPAAGESLNVGTLFFDLRQPLLRGRGEAATAAAELSADRRLAAARFDLRHRIAERIEAVVSRYWTAVAARLDLEILTASERDAGQLLATTRQLVDADVMPAADLVQVEANSAAKTASRVQAEHQLFQARQDLEREIGLALADLGTLPAPSDPLPEPPPAEQLERLDAGHYVEQALQRRADLEAARQRQQAAEAVVRAADNGLQPRLDLSLTLGYSGVEVGGAAGLYLSSLGRNLDGLSTTALISLAWPTNNRQAEGIWAQATANLQQRALTVEAFARSIGTDVPTAVDAVRSDALRLATAAQAAALFRQAVTNEEKKLRAGSSTLIDVISQRDRLTQAEENRLAVQLALARSLLDLRFQTGTLLAPAGDTEAVTLAQLTTLPF